MVSLENSVIARLKTHGLYFEILVDPDLALSFKRGEEQKIEHILAVEKVFENASRGDRAPENDLIKAFGSTEVKTIAKKIIMDGEISLTADQRRRMVEEKKKKVIHTIARNAINPQTHAPHPPSRIEHAMEEAKIHIDPFKSTEKLVQEVLKAIRPIIPIRFEEVDIAVKIPPPYSAKAYGEVSSFGTLVRQEWQNDGSWIAIVRIPAGIQGDFYDLLNNSTKGTAEAKLLRK